MQNRPRPQLSKMLRKLQTLIAVVPGRGAFHSATLESARLREVQLELDLFAKKPRPWSFTD